MVSLLLTLVALSAAMYHPLPVPLPAPPPGAVVLRYHRPPGQRARYRMHLDVQGSQTSLGETIPVRWQAEVEVSEQVLSSEPDGSLWLAVSARPSKIVAANGAFGNAALLRWPDLRLHLAPTGEILETAPRQEGAGSSAQQRALLSFMAQPSLVLLPEAPVSPGDEWQSASATARQTNRLLQLAGEGPQQTAHITSTASWPLALRETVEDLGLSTFLEGEARQSSHLMLLTRFGVPSRHQGQMRLVTKSRVTLILPEGPDEFLLQSDLAVAFDLRLLSIDGRPVGAQ